MKRKRTATLHNMSLILRILFALVIFTWWVSWCDAQTIFQAARPLTVVDRGLKAGQDNSPQSPGVRTANTGALQNALDEGIEILHANGYGVHVPAGYYWINPIVLDNRRGGVFEGASGAAWHENAAQDGPRTIFIAGDTATYVDPSTWYNDETDLIEPPWSDIFINPPQDEEPLVKFNGAGVESGAFSIVGKQPRGDSRSGEFTDRDDMFDDADGDALEPQLNVGLYIEGNNGTGVNTGKHQFRPMGVRHCNVGVMIGDNTVTGDNGDTCHFDFIDIGRCLVGVAVVNQQAVENSFRKIRAVSTGSIVEIVDGGSLTFDYIVNLGSGSVCRFYDAPVTRPTATFNNVIIDPLELNYFGMDTGPQFPVLILEDRSVSVESFARFVWRNVQLHEDLATHGGTLGDGGPILETRASQWHVLENWDRCYRGMISAADHTDNDRKVTFTLDQMRLRQGSGGDREVYEVNNVRYGPQLFVEPGGLTVGDQASYRMNVGTWGLTADGADSQGVQDRGPLYIVCQSNESNEGSMREERYLSGKHLGWYQERTDAIGTAVSTGTTKATFTVPSWLNGGEITGFLAITDSPGVTGTMTFSVENSSNADAELFSNLPEITGAGVMDTTRSTGDGYTIDAANDDLVTNDIWVVDFDSVHSTPAEGCTIYIECTPAP